MKDYLTVAAIQLSPDHNVARNISKAVAGIYEAKRKGAEFVILPELFLYRGNPKHYKNIAEEKDGTATCLFRNIAKSLGVDILLGTIIEKSTRANKFYDTSIHVSAQGHIMAVYRKINLFEVQLKRKRICEKDYFLKGNKVVSYKVAGHTMGIAICFDIRFPNLMQRLVARGVEVLCVPANFTHTTGKAHWTVLLRNRAIETQSFIIAANCCGIDPHTKVRSYGHSMIIDPWGTVIKEAGSREEIIIAQLDFKSLRAVRKKLPLKTRY